MKRFFEPTTKKVAATLILFLILPMYGTVYPVCLAVVGIECGPQTGFIGIPAIYFFGEGIDLLEAWSRSPESFGIHLNQFLSTLVSLLPYLAIAYLIVCTVAWFLNKKKNYS